MDRAFGQFRLLGVTRNQWKDDEGKLRQSVKLHVLQEIRADEGFGQVTTEFKARESVLDYVRADWPFPVLVELSMEISQRSVRASGREGTYQLGLYDVVVDGLKLVPEGKK